MFQGKPHITVCICTLQRQQLLRKLLEELKNQRTDERFTFSIVVADNDVAESSRELVQEFARSVDFGVVYCCEPQRNIALARNRALAHASGDYIAFIDDDEFPLDDWLLLMFNACEHYGAAGILGPVRPHFETSPPRWIIDGRFCERPEYPTGRIMDWEESRTGNLLFQRSIIDCEAEPFKAEFGTGGEDKDFFMRMTQRGYVFRWCNEGITYETVPPVRWTRRYMMRRALLRGKNVLKHPVGRMKLITQSFVAVPIYSLVLPVMLPFGQHIFMRYCIKWCDHLGRILAVFGLNAANER